MHWQWTRIVGGRGDPECPYMFYATVLSCPPYVMINSLTLLAAFRRHRI